jgi:hypothetical protein
MLLALLDVVRSHYFLPRPPQMDPVVTSNEAMLRFEGFSGCCGVYVRVDLDTAGLQAERLGRGTTNVDFNLPMRAALMRLQDNERVEFSVGREAFALSHGAERVVEKKVSLPLRWIKGFSEVQAYQPRLLLMADVNGVEARHFARSLPLGSVPQTAVVRRPVRQRLASESATGHRRGADQRPATPADLAGAGAAGRTAAPLERRDSGRFGLGGDLSGRAGDPAGQPRGAAGLLG